MQEITREVVGIHVLLTRSLFGDGILRRLLLRVSLAKPTSAVLRCSWLPEMKLQFGPRLRAKSRETPRGAGAIRHSTSVLLVFRRPLPPRLSPQWPRKCDSQGLRLQPLVQESMAWPRSRRSPDSLLFRPRSTRRPRLLHRRRCAPTREERLDQPAIAQNSDALTILLDSMPGALLQQHCAQSGREARQKKESHVF